ncbi:hypothetical protein YQE_04112, partial [Dendroctonus ponderosae]
LKVGCVAHDRSCKFQITSPFDYCQTTKLKLFKIVPNGFSTKMTSTNVFQGMHGNKNSSKVIKPPGGGHTDIFGAPDPPVKRDSGRNASSITEGTNAGVQSPTAPKAPVPQPQPQTQPQPKSEAPAAAGRVPPGGFSSGPFW